MRRQSHKLIVDVGEDPVSAESLIVPPEVLKALPGVQWSEAFVMIVLKIVHHEPRELLWLLRAVFFSMEPGLEKQFQSP